MPQLLVKYGGCNDRDMGGFVFGDTQWNLRLCVEDKMHRIAHVRHKYPEWWLGSSGSHRFRG